MLFINSKYIKTSNVNSKRMRMKWVSIVKMDMLMINRKRNLWTCKI